MQNKGMYRNVWRLSDNLNISYDHGALVEPLAVAVHALKRGGDIKRRKILILGAGPIGNLVAQAANGMGAQSVMITEISDYRLIQSVYLRAKYGYSALKIAEMVGLKLPTVKNIHAAYLCHHQTHHWLAACLGIRVFGITDGAPASDR